MASPESHVSSSAWCPKASMELPALKDELLFIEFIIFNS